MSSASLRTPKPDQESGPSRMFSKVRSVAFWKRQARTWHWMSGAICLIGMLLFAFTGITLNHADEIKASPMVEEREFILSDASLSLISEAVEFGDGAALPAGVVREVKRALGADVAGVKGEWTEVDVYLSLPRPGGDAWLTIDRASGDVFYEVTRRGAVSYLNDLHKGRNTGQAWSLFLDVFSGACIVFCLTGLWLLQIHSRSRGSTWPLVGAGIGIPVVLLLFLVHL